jgi:hypothetical protein
MQNVSTANVRPVRVRMAIFLGVLIFAAAAVVGVLINGLAHTKLAPVTHAITRSVGTAPATHAISRSVGTGPAAHDRSWEGVGTPIPVPDGQSGDPRPVRGKPF